MTQKELREAMKIRPVLKQIDHILGKNATPGQKMELFVLVQAQVEAAMKRTLHDLTCCNAKEADENNPYFRRS